MITITDVFNWIGEAATGGLDVISSIANGLQTLFFVSGDSGTTGTPTLLGILILAGVGAPLAWKFIKYIISLFKKVQTN